MAVQRILARVSSTTLRFAAIIFFRLAILPTVVFACFAAYVPSFIAAYYAVPTLEVRNDTITVTVEETVSPSSNGGSAVVTDDVKIEEDVVLSEKDTKPWKIILWGSPGVRHFWSSALTFSINLALVLLTADALYRGRWLYPADDLSFVRLGYTSHNEARFLIREPDQAAMPVSIEIHIKDPHPPFDNTLWHTAGVVHSTTDETDFTATMTVPLIHSQQRVYEWRTSNNHSGEFLSPPKPGQMPEYHDGKYTFLSTSCILPRFPYNPLDHALAIPGLRPLAAKLPDLGAQFMLFLGDFIYIDVPQRFGKSVEEYRMKYRQVYASPDWAPVAQNLSWIHVLDDHEISNDWSGGNEASLYKAAVEPFNIYQGNLNPPAAIKAGSSSARRQDATWFEFAQGPASFFLMDTRSYRSDNDVPSDDSDKTMLGQDQLEDFLAWLARPMPRGIKWKFVASSVPFTKNWPINVEDTWGGFLGERSRILEAMWDTGAQGTPVVILSGDRHEFAATKFPPPPDSRWPQSAAAYEFSTSPLDQFSGLFDTYRQTDDEDIKLGYIPTGTSKFGAFTIEDVDGQSQLHYRLFIDGEERWSMDIVPPPPPPPVWQVQGENTLSSLWSKIRQVYE
ncbi:alkaline phosphatase D [Geosmithia morbida]|uniref:Alkaline phosphatase D n=1 Tax=Geosmithia morbida TaxID=1094350 RepID=A0A9P4YPW9_9HYPO|nr:alkaline phosphatase D [Geosmithia morbida]KAF4120570.1 alkaline phosphatase D [Geosmithia morbida]